MNSELSTRLHRVLRQRMSKAYNVLQEIPLEQILLSFKHCLTRFSKIIPEAFCRYCCKFYHASQPLLFRVSMELNVKDDFSTVQKNRPFKRTNF